MTDQTTQTDAHVEVINSVPVTVAVTVDVTPAPVIATPEKYYCSNCRETWDVHQVRKDSLDYGRQSDGTLTAPGLHGRFSVFCKKCMKFLMIIDPSTKDAKTQFVGR